MQSLTHTTRQLFPPIAIARDLLGKLRGAPLLLGWLVIGPLVALLVSGTIGMVQALINLGLLGFWAVLIRWMTPDAPPPLPLRRPRRELLALLTLLALLFGVQLLDFEVITAQPFSNWVRDLRIWLYTGTQQLASFGAPDWALHDLYNAASSAVKQLLPFGLLALAMGYGLRGMGLRPCCWRLTTMLLGLTIGLGLPFGVLFMAPLGQVLALYLVNLLINGLPEELIFRGLLLPRLAAALANPLNALVVAALLFNAIHIPIAIYNGTSGLMALLAVFSTSFPSGLIWGYLYLRTRSIIPGALWHTAHVNLGLIFASMV